MKRGPFIYRIHGVRVCGTNIEDAIELIKQCVAEKCGGHICFTNWRMIQLAAKDSDVYQMMEKSLMNLPDGRPVAWCGQLYGHSGISATDGPSVFMELLQQKNTMFRHFLLGDTEEVVHEIIERYTTENQANIVGGTSLPFAEVADFDYSGISELIKKSGANIVWTAMRAPKQDFFNQRISALCPGVLFMGVGRAFRLSIGKIADAPAWMKKCGLAGLVTRRESLIRVVAWYAYSAFDFFSCAVKILFTRLKQGLSGQRG